MDVVDIYAKQWLRKNFFTKILKKQEEFAQTSSCFKCMSCGNRNFLNSKNSYFQKEAKSKTFLVKMCFIWMRLKIYHHVNGFTLSLTLKQRLGITQKGLLSCKNITSAALVSRLHRYPVVMYMKIQWHNFKRKLLRCIIHQIWCFSQPGFSLSNSNVDSLFTCLMWKMHLISLVFLISVVMSAVDCNNCCPELKIFNVCLWLNGFWRS